MRENRRAVWRRASHLVAAGALTVGLSACGGDGDPPPPPPTGVTVTPCTQEVLFQNNGPVPGRTLVFGDFSVPRTGRLDITMDWTNAESRLGFYLVPANTCTLEEFNDRTCDFLIRSEASGPKPRIISEPSFAAGNYRRMIGNFSDEDESAALEIVLSEGDCAPVAGSRPSVSQQDDVSAESVSRALHN